MKRKAKRLWVLLLCLCLALTMTAVPAAGEETVASGTVEEVNDAANLQAALKNESYGTVKLSGDIITDVTLTVSRTVTLDLNGYVLQYKNDSTYGSVIKVESGGKLTLIDSQSNKEHKFNENENGLWVLDEKGDKIVNGGIITGGTGMKDPNLSDQQRFGGGVFVSDNAEFVMSGGSIAGCYALTDETYYRGYGGGVYVSENASFTMKPGAKIIGCTAYGGGGVYAEECTFDMEGGTIESCVAATYGGGVYAPGSTMKFIMQEGAEISKCKAGQRGGGVYAGSGLFDMQGGLITGCETGSGYSYYGGGVYVTGIFKMSGNAVIEKCTAKKGSGLYNFDGATTTISGNARIDGTIYNEGTLNANGGTINGKVTNENESAPYRTATITGDINDSDTIFNGEVENNKGGIIEKGIFKSEVTNEADGVISGGTFEGKVTNESGGTINNGTFNGEVTNNGGTISGGTFEGNVTNNGGIINGGTFYGTVTDNGTSTSYIVTFRSENKDYAKQYVAKTESAKATEPPAPTREGYTFGGWYNGNTPWDFNADVIQSMTLTAKWTSTSSSGGGGHYSRTQTPQITCGTGGKATLSTDGRTLTITPDAEKEIDKVTLNGKELGAVTTVTNLKTGDKVEISFKDKVTEPTKEELDKQVKETVAKVKLKARSVKLKDGRLRITISGDVQDLQNLQELGYTVKYKFYRSTSKASKYKAALEKAGKTFTTGKGTKGTRYYYKARLMVYDKDGKLIAKSELKQCRYATRILGK